MIAIVVMMVLATLFGWTLCRTLDPTLPPRMLLGSSFLLGTGGAALGLWLLSLLHLQWSPLQLAVVLLIVASACVVRRPIRFFTPRFPRSTFSRLAFSVDVLTFVVVIGYALYATLAAPWEWDFWSIWGLKGRVFWSARSIDWTFLLDREHLFAHADYPLLLPLTFDLVALIGGQWNDRWLGILYVGFAAATLLILRDAIEEDHGTVAGAVTAFALSGCCCSIWIGLAEGPMLAYGTAGLLLIRRSVGRDNSLSLAGSMLLGFAALTKNEGLTLLAAALVGIAIVRLKRTFSLLPLLLAGGAALLWIVTRAFFHFQAADFDPRRLPGTFLNIPFFLRTVTTVSPHHPGLWVLFGIVMVSGGLLFFTKERFLITTLVTQVLACWAVYAFSVRDLGWLVRSSWPRVSSQLEVVLGFVVASFILDRFYSESPEARSRRQRLE